MTRTAWERLRRGLALTWEALRLLGRTRGIKRYAVLPVLAGVVLYVCLAAGLFVAIWHWEPGPFAWDFWGGWGARFAACVSWLAHASRWLLVVPALLSVWFTFTPVCLVLASPFNDYLSEKAERALGAAAVPAPADGREWLRWLLRSIGCSLRIAAKQIGLSLLLLPLLLVPGVGWFAFFVLGAYFAGMGYTDVALARHGLPYAAKRAFWRAHRWELLGLGVAGQAALLVPGAGLVAVPVGVVAGTTLCLEDRPAV